MKARDPIERLRDIASELDDCAASKSEHGWSPASLKIRMCIDEIEAQYMKLPVDADGVTIRPGDVLIDYLTKRHVCGVGCSEIILGGYPESGEQGMRYGLPCNYRHAKHDTVESELAMFLTACGDEDPHHYDEQIAEFAERIRKAVEL